MIYTAKKQGKARDQKRALPQKETPQGSDTKGGTQITNTSFDFATNRAMWLLATVATLATKKRTCRAGVTRGTIRTKAKAPALENVKSVEVATPTVKRGFVMPKISRHGFAHIGMVCGHGWGYPQGHPHGYGRVFNSHAHPLRLKTYRVVLYPVGAKTMQQVNLLVRPSAPVSKAVPAITEAQAFALLEATSNASLAAFYLRKGNVAAARRKAVQLLKSLQVLEVAHA